MEEKTAKDEPHFHSRPHQSLLSTGLPDPQHCVGHGCERQPLPTDPHCHSLIGHGLEASILPAVKLIDAVLLPSGILYN